MNQNVLQTDLSGKVAVVTGAGGILYGHMAKALARAGAKVALVNRSEEAINQYAAEIRVEGGIAKAYKGNVLSKADMERIADEVLKDLSPCDILVNGAGGNNPRATTDKEYYEDGDLDREDVKSFFDLDDEGVNMVLGLNFNGTLIPTQAFTKHMIRSGGGNIINICLYPSDHDPCLFRRQGRGVQLYPVAGSPFLQSQHPGQCHRSRLLLQQAEPQAAVE